MLGCYLCLGSDFPRFKPNYLGDLSPFCLFIHSILWSENWTGSILINPGREGGNFSPLRLLGRERSYDFQLLLQFPVGSSCLGAHPSSEQPHQLLFVLNLPAFDGARSSLGEKKSGIASQRATPSRLPPLENWIWFGFNSADSSCFHWALSASCSYKHNRFPRDSRNLFSITPASCEPLWTSWPHALGNVRSRFTPDLKSCWDKTGLCLNPAAAS